MAAVLNPQVQRVNTIIRNGSCTVTLQLPPSGPVVIDANDIKAPSVADEVVKTKNDNGDEFVFAKVEFSWKAPDLSFGAILQYEISFDTEMRPTGEENSNNTDIGPTIIMPTESSNNTDVGPNNNSSVPSVNKRQTSTDPDASDSRITPFPVSQKKYIHIIRT